MGNKMQTKNNNCRTAKDAYDSNLCLFALIFHKNSPINLKKMYNIYLYYIKIRSVNCKIVVNKQQRIIKCCLNFKKSTIVEKAKAEKQVNSIFIDTY